MKKSLDKHQIEYLKTDDLIPYDKNPRFNDEAVPAVVESIKTAGFLVPIVIDKNNVIAAGHTRLKAAKKLGLKEVPCIRADDLTDQEIQAFRLADNRTSELATWNTDLLNEELKEITDIDMSALGFAEELESIDLDDDLDTAFDDKNDDVMYFSSDEIQEEIVNDWKNYETVEEFASNMIDYPSAMYEFNRLCQGYRAGYNISLLFNPHRLNVSTIQSDSLFYGFNNDPKYKKSYARYMVNVENKVPPRNQYYKMIGIGTAGYQYVNEFPPYLARDIYKKYVREGYKVLNPCAGWGGRLIGIASCMFKDIEYVETDPSTKTFEGLKKLKQFLKLGDNYKQYNKPFEELELKDNYFDFVFTSPPYFDTEIYSDEETQSYNGCDSYEAWKQSFLYVMIDKIIKCMKDSGVCILNVGNKRYPIGEDTRNYLSDKYGIECNDLDYSLDNDSDKAIRASKEDFLLFRKGE